MLNSRYFPKKIYRCGIIYIYVIYIYNCNFNLVIELLHLNHLFNENMHLIDEICRFFKRTITCTKKSVIQRL